MFLMTAYNMVLGAKEMLGWAIGYTPNVNQTQAEYENEVEKIDNNKTTESIDARLSIQHSRRLSNNNTPEVNRISNSPETKSTSYDLLSYLWHSDDKKDLALWRSVFNETSETFQMRLNNGANPNFRDYEHPQASLLHYVAELDDAKKAQVLLNSGADVNAITQYNGNVDESYILTPLNQELEKNNVLFGKLGNRISCEIDKMTEAERRGDYQYTALHLAALRGNVDVVKVLSAARYIDKNAKTHHGRTALDLANEQWQFIQTEKSKNDQSLASYWKAEEQRYRDVLRLLLPLELRFEHPAFSGRKMTLPGQKL